jgi:hypothetical protein
MAKDCLSCGLQFSDTTTFCPGCGRPTDSGFKIRPMQESALDRLRWEMAVSAAAMGGGRAQRYVDTKDSQEQLLWNPRLS